jgi:hypothetical protein
VFTCGILKLIAQGPCNNNSVSQYSSRRAQRTHPPTQSISKLLEVGEQEHAITFLPAALKVDSPAVARPGRDVLRLETDW